MSEVYMKQIFSYNKHKIVIDLSTIAYAERKGRYTYLYKSQGNMEIKIRESLQQIREASEGILIQTHRSYLVNKKYIHKVAYQELCLVQGNMVRQIPIGRRYQEELDGILQTISK